MFFLFYLAPHLSLDFARIASTTKLDPVLMVGMSRRVEQHVADAQSIVEGRGQGPGALGVNCQWTS